MQDVKLKINKDIMKPGFIKVCGIDNLGEYVEVAIDRDEYNNFYTEEIKSITNYRQYSSTNYRLSIREEAEIKTIKNFTTIDTDKFYTLHYV